VRCSAFGQLAENIAESLSKGSAVVVSGRLRSQSWSDETGQRRSEVQMLADAVGVSLRHHPARSLRADRTPAPVAAAEPEPPAV
jgi:single-strand DNA-binding protein